MFCFVLFFCTEISTVCKWDQGLRWGTCWWKVKGVVLDLCTQCLSLILENMVLKIKIIIKNKVLCN